MINNESGSVRTQYIVLRNPHSGLWLMFKYVDGQDKYAPTYGCPIHSGDTPEECIRGAIKMWGMKENEVEIA